MFWSSSVPFWLTALFWATQPAVTANLSIFYRFNVNPVLSSRNRSRSFSLFLVFPVSVFKQLEWCVFFFSVHSLFFYCGFCQTFQHIIINSTSYCSLWVTSMPAPLLYSWAGLPPCSRVPNCSWKFSSCCSHFKVALLMQRLQSVCSFNPFSSNVEIFLS